MSKKKKNYKEKNPFLMVLYMITAAALIACLVWLVMCSRQRRAEYQETLAIMAENETEYVRESHQAAETESETAGEKTSEESDGSAGTSSEESEDSMETNTADESSAGLSGDELSLSNVKDTAIMILNGTERSGVASYWAEQLKNDGYTDVTAASYHESAGDQTTIYTDNELCAEELKEIFPDAVVETGTPDGDFTLGDSEEEPEGEIEAYIVIGSADAEYE